MNSSKIGKNIFNNTVKISENSPLKYKDINSLKISTAEKSNIILKEKNIYINKILDENTKNIIKKNFCIDGSIKIQINELTTPKEVEKLKDFTYRQGDNIIFRGEKYYYLFDSIKTNGINKISSINNIKINDINTDLFIKELYEHNCKNDILLMDYLKASINKNSNIENNKKIILGLIDSKINILAFILNYLLILSDKNFLNQNFTGNIIFNSNDVINIKNNTGENFNIFQQNKNTFFEMIPIIQKELEFYCGIFTNMLINNNINYNNILKNIEDINTKELIEQSIKSPLKCYFDLILKYVNNYRDQNNIKKKKYELKKGNVEGFKDISGYTNAINNKTKSFNKLIRLYREENNPLLMIKTGINAYNNLSIKDKYEVNLISVSYGGITVSSYVKPILEKLSSNKLTINNSIITYSIYDLKNKGDNLEINDYPFSKINEIKYITIANMEKILESRKKTHNFEKINDISNKIITLILDDNSFSGETLNNLKKLFNDKKYYNIHNIPCRANFDMSKYSKELNDTDFLEILINSGIDLRTSKIGSNGKRKYNELLGVYIGNRLYKLKNNIPL